MIFLLIGPREIWKIWYVVTEITFLYLHGVSVMKWIIQMIRILTLYLMVVKIPALVKLLMEVIKKRHQMLCALELSPNV
ncbi:hypothetical protein D3C80_2063480 [compost metagenome]